MYLRIIMLTLIDRNLNVESLPLLTKMEIADLLLDRILGKLNER